MRASRLDVDIPAPILRAWFRHGAVGRGELGSKPTKNVLAGYWIDGVWFLRARIELGSAKRNNMRHLGTLTRACHQARMRSHRLPTPITSHKRVGKANDDIVR